ncbi:hypothetical protein DLAC_10692 [Tieghemostelium lacteum]|uniref:Importin N-terminal domain-containing protein n=1 Tax=Tieghemostelium lacteum TaxID=361077 RepID=A0A151Z4I7_TIELA|nr:hypothetical protein DLAC_10692 [Tieghemostelium lacteum]|eukprot:KYQ88883.1 hypothetical protein DLAC_10692 [Tieghemostelium lacteum]
MNQSLLENITGYYKDSLSSIKNVRENGTNSIKELLKNQDNLLVFLEICGTGDQIDSGLKTFISVIVKNEIKENYPEKDTTENLITPERKEIIKEKIIGIILTSTNQTVQAQLLEALSIITQNDFPTEKWPSLVPQLSLNLETQLASQNYQNINKILNILQTILKRYQEEMHTTSVMIQLKAILESLASVYLKTIVHTSTLIDSTQNGDELKLLFTSIKYQLQIYFSLSYIDIPEAFEDSLESICPVFIKYLSYRSQLPQLMQSKNDDDAPLLNQVQTLICDIINHFTLKYDDIISNYLQSFVQTAWVLLSQTSNEVKNDHLVFSAILLLGSASMSIKRDIFSSVETLQQICSNIIIPNIKLRESDIELFEDEKVEYMRRDIEGSDSDTRRRASIELVKGLRKFFEEQTTQILSGDIEKLLLEYQKNPSENWLSKDSAIFLVTALAIKSFEQKENKLIKSMDFYKHYIDPELANPNCPDLLRADCLKFVTIFREEIPVQEYPRLVQLVIPCLQNPDYIVHTYASSCIDKLLTVKDQNQLRLQLSPQDLPALLVPLANVFNFPCSKQNERTMRTIVRIVLRMIGKVDKDTTIQLLKKFTSIILEEAKNPSNHLFDHYCFEVIGSLLKTFSSEAEIFQIVVPLVEYVLQNDVAEFTPYIFQLLAVLVESAKPENLQNFHSALHIITQAVVWKNHGNIPALVRLLQAYLKKDSAFIAQNNLLTPIFGIFQKLLSMPSQDHEGFYLLESIVEFVPLESYKDMISKIFDLIIQRISTKKTEKILRCFIVFLCVFIAKNTVEVTSQAIKFLRADLWTRVLDKLWLPTALTISGPIEKKILSVGQTYLLTNMEIFQSPDELWLRLLKCQYSLLTGQVISNEQSESLEDKATYLEEDPEGYTPSFTQLQFCKKLDVDPFPTVSPKQFFLQQIHAFASSNEAVLTQIQRSGISLQNLEI